MATNSVSPTSGPDAFGKPESLSHPAPSLALNKPTTNAKSKPRKRVNTAEKRNQHNAIERARRETLNSKFLVLAGLLPSLASHRRPSKSAIVNGSINHLTHSRNQRLLAAKLLRELCGDRDALLKEVNEWRSSAGFAPHQGASAWSEEMEQVCSVDNEIFGTFANFDGEGDDEADDENEASYDSQNMLGSTSTHSSAVFDSQRIPSIFEAPVTSLPTANATPNLEGISWSHEFAFTHLQNAGTSTASNTNINSMGANNSSIPAPFGTFLAETAGSASDSPTSASNFATNMLTPPGTSDGLRSNASQFIVALPSHTQVQTPSPRSSSSGGLQTEDKYVSTQSQGQSVAQTAQWTPQQLLLLQHMQQQQNLRQSFASSTSSNGSFSATPSQSGIQNPFESMYQQRHNSVPYPTQQKTSMSSDNFTQSLMTSMVSQQPMPSPFLPGMSANTGMTTPGGMVPEDQIQQWRKAAMAGYIQAQTQNQGANQGSKFNFEQQSWQRFQGQGPMGLPLRRQTVEGF